MYVVMVASECAPVAKVGGLGDVVYGLSRELENRGHRVEVILPRYDCLREDHIEGLHVAMEHLMVPWYEGEVATNVWAGTVHGQKCYFIEPRSRDDYFSRGLYYGCYDDPLRFAFFSKAALEFMLKAGKAPDLIHTHDWQTGLVPVLLYEIYAHHGMPHQRVIHTIHNFAHQGICGPEVLRATGLNRPDYYYEPDRLRDDSNHAALNLMKGAITYANFVTTVSPQHAWETRFTEQGHGLGHTLHRFQDRFGGILNGLDYDMWNPARDPHIPSHYSLTSPEGKAGNKAALRDRLGLELNERPILAYVGRLDTQKGVHLIRHAIAWSLRHGGQFVLLGSGVEPGINDFFLDLKHHYADDPNCHLEIGFNEELSRLIYAGADMIVVPSIFEPCGLTQMIGLRYGTVPIVRTVGGLKDTVFDWDHSDRPLHERNGFVFEHADYPGIESALSRAMGLWHDSPALFRQLQRQGMACDYSWRHPAEHYANLYEFVRHK